MPCGAADGHDAESSHRRPMRVCRDPPNATWCVSSIDLATSRLPPAARSTRGTNHGCRLPHTPSPEERASVPGPRFALRRWQEGLNRNDPRTNCYRRDGGQQAFLEQRAFVELLASNQPPSPKFRGGLYNQVRRLVETLAHSCHLLRERHAHRKVQSQFASRGGASPWPSVESGGAGVPLRPHGTEGL